MTTSTRLGARARRAFTSALAAATMAVVLPTGAVAEQGVTGPFAQDEVTQLDRINEERRERGLEELELHPMLTRLAREHSMLMAGDASQDGAYCGDGNTLRHRAPLSDGVTENWSRLRENVGCDGYEDSANHVHEAFMHSPGHKANIVADDVEYVGVGVYYDNMGVLWTTQIFMQSADWEQNGLPPTSHPVTEVLDEGVLGSQAAFPTDDSADFVLVGRSNGFADSLGGAALAGGRGPVLFTDGKVKGGGETDPVLNPGSRTELDRVLADGGKVYLLGGTAAVSAQTESELVEAGYDVERLAGPGRQETSVAIARALVAEYGTPEKIFVANGWNWPDAITGGAAAASAGIPVVLAHKDSVHADVRAFLAEHPDAQVFALGGRAALSDAVVEQVGATRLSGATRVDTAVTIAENIFGQADGHLVVNNAWGQTEWGIALSWASLAAGNDAPQVLVQPNFSQDMPRLVEFLQDNADTITSVTFGSTIQQSVRDEVMSYLPNATS